MSGPIDNLELAAKTERVRVALEPLDECERAIAYKYLYNVGERIDGIDNRIHKLAPRKAAA